MVDNAGQKERSCPGKQERNRICRKCHREYPIEQFRNRSKYDDSRVNECRLCHNSYERLRRQHKRGVLTKQHYQKHLTSLKEQQTSRGVERVFLSLAQLCGGIEGLLELLADAMEKDFKAGGVKAHRHIATIIRLMQYHEAQQHRETAINTM